ncbi:MAG: T9SS type A sorting domain-containing protein [Candidatus Cloacimonetes bacterium]|nr:T9SS type A sorting domain-containing protein [Candidatus Cloacimonadota bacterium]
MKIVFTLVLVIITFCVFSETIYIPEDILTIQGGIEAASNGDSVIVSPGIYVENINFNGKAITLGSLFCTTQDTSYISQTIIDGGQNGSVVTFASGEDTTSVLTGFTIRNGSGEYPATDENGGGIYCSESGSLLSDLVIESNSADEEGGGLYFGNSDAILRNLTVANNTARKGGGICSRNSDIYLENIIITDDVAQRDGGGIYLSGNNPVLKGINITNCSASYGRGGGIYIENSGPILEDVTITLCNARYGGGLDCLSADVSLTNVSVRDNEAFYYGGGIGCYNTILDFNSENRCSIYSNTASNFGSGNDIYSSTTQNVIVDTFTVLHPTIYHVLSSEVFTYDIIHNVIEQVESDLYVSPEGDNENSGLNSEEPLRNIWYAISIIYSDSLNPLTIHLSDGIYSSTSNNENFPLCIPFNTTLSGVSFDEVLLDGEMMTNIINNYYTESVVITNITITNGFSGYGGGIYFSSGSLELDNVMIWESRATEGGGIICSHSNLVITNSWITENTAEDLMGSKGGGLYLHESTAILEHVIISGNTAYNGSGIYCANNSNLNLINVRLENNEATGYGGGLYLENDLMVHIENTLLNNNHAEGTGGGIYNHSSLLTMAGVTISNNSAQNLGGGIYTAGAPDSLFSESNRCSIYRNITGQRGPGRDIYSTGYIEVIVDTFTIMNPTDYYSSPLENFSFDILHSYYESVSSDLYVSPAGNDNNTGISIYDPLQTITHALEIIQADSLNPRIIYLAEGTYSPSISGEIFPLCPYDYITVSGSGINITIIDAEGTDQVISIIRSDSVNISGLTLTNGNSTMGGGIYCSSSTIDLEDLKITNSIADEGGGIYCTGSTANFENLEISNCDAIIGGGIFTCYNPEMILDRTLIVENHSINDGIIDCLASTLILKNTTVAQNTGNSGSSISQYNSYVLILNSIFRNNFDYELYADGDDLLTVTNSDVMQGLEGVFSDDETIVSWLEGNIDEDPLFADPENGNYQLSADSPCIDAGTAYFEYEGEILIDLEEDEYWSAAPDMGAYEYYPVAENEDEIEIENGKLKIENYPNPFNPETTISFFTTEGTENTELSIYNLKGQLIRKWKIDPSSLHYAATSNGKWKINKIVWNGRNSDGKAVSSGVYLMQLKTDKQSLSKKIMLLK